MLAIQKIEAFSQINDGANDRRPLNFSSSFEFPRPFEGSGGITLPKINARAEPIVIVPADLEMALLLNDLSRHGFIAPVETQNKRSDCRVAHDYR